jgi:hypothetical protein
VIRRLVAVVAIVCVGGCASTATIARTDGPDNETQIDSSDAGALYVRARNGRIYRIPRESIASIDHPGNVEILVGGILAALTVIIAGDIKDNSNREDAYILAAVYGAPALWLITSGLVKYVPSVQAAHAFESAEPAPPAPWLPPPLPAAAPPMPPPAAPAGPPPPLTAPPPLPAPEEAAPEVVPGATSPQ